MIDAKDLPVLLDYNPGTGKLFWRLRPLSMFKDDACMRRWNTRWAGKEALTATHIKGYLCGQVKSNVYLAHRVIWGIQHGEWPDQIDHVNGDKQDNRIENLRSVSNAVNHQNMPLTKRNTSGYQNVYFDKKAGKWCARAGINGKSHHIGYYNSADEAGAARLAVDQQLGFHPNHGAR